MVDILITLPADRTKPGTLFLGGAPICGCLGKADSEAAAQHGNASRDPLQPWGDTPVGTYAPVAPAQIGDTQPHMGSVILPLNATHGDALQARLNGRTGLAIHGGRGDGGGPYAGYFPTDGCVRVFDKDMAALVARIGDNRVSIAVISEG